jgi:hypothetical protein
LNFAFRKNYQNFELLFYLRGGCGSNVLLQEAIKLLQMTYAWSRLCFGENLTLIKEQVVENPGKDLRKDSEKIK